MNLNDLRGVCKALEGAKIESSTLEIVGSEEVLKKSVKFLQSCGV